jgi:hypothetical protein
MLFDCALGRCESPVERWVEALMPVLAAPTDVPTIDHWARLLGLSRSTLCNRCRAVGAGPKASLNVARIARTLRLGDPACWRPEDALADLDPRTCLSLLEQTGLRASHHAARPTISMLLAQPVHGIPGSCLYALERAAGKSSDAFPTVSVHTAANAAPTIRAVHTRRD